MKARTGSRGQGHESVRQRLWDAAHAPDEELPYEPRRLVPSPRMRELGLVEDEPPPPPRAPRPAPPRRPLRRRLRDALSEYRPSRVTGGLSALPLLVIGGVNLLEGLHARGLEILVFYMREDLGFSLVFLITLGQVIGIAQTLLAPFVGYLVDRVNRVRLAFVGATGFGLSSLLTGFASTPAQLAAARAFGGIVSSTNLPTHQPLLADYYPPQSRGRVFSFRPLMEHVGVILGPLVGGGIAQLWGWRAAFFILGGLGTVAGAAFLLLREPVRGGMDRAAAGAGDRADEPPPPPPGLVESWRACASIVTLRRLWYAEPFLAVGGTGLFLLLTAYQVQVLAIPPGLLGVIAALNSALTLAGLLVGAPLVDRLLAFRPGRVMTMLGVLLIVDVFVFVALGTIPVLPVVLALSLTLPFINSILVPARATLESLVIPARIRGIGLQSKAPWQLLGKVLSLVLVALALRSRGIQGGMLVFVPLFLVGAVLHIAAAGGVERDIRAARAANLADVESRESRRRGRAKLLVCRDVDVHYDGVQVLFGVDFDVEEGEIVALLGTNGAGKSTLLRAISGLTEASNGAIFLDGRDITHVPPYEIAARRVVQMPGGRGIFPTLTVEENLRAATWLSEDDPEVREARMRRVLDELFPVLRDRLHTPAGSLSGGEQQMLALGQAFLMHPRLLMIDELSLGLAPAVVEQLIRVLREIRDAGSTIILVEQSVNLALTIADRAVFMEKGEVRFEGPTAQLLRRPDILRSVFLRSAARGPSPAARRERLQAGAGAAVLQAEDLHVAFGGIRALRGASLEVRAGEIVGVIGANGAGKTTLFDAISGFVHPDRGRVVLGGRDVTARGPDERARLGLGRSFQDARLFPSMTVRENIEVALEHQLDVRGALWYALWLPRGQRAARRARRRAEHLIELLGLGDYADKFVGELSTGSRRIVDLACAMAAEPEVLLLDEPSSGIAQAEAEELGPLLRRVRRETGCALVVIEHHIPLLTQVADRLVAMHLGEVIADGEPEAVVRDGRVVEAYLGTREQDLVASLRGRPWR